MSQLLPYQPSLASATNTRVDSACKHIQQCRVSTDDMMQYTVPKNDSETLQREKYRFCVHKDEPVIGIGRAWKTTHNRKRTNNAYPRVISNLGCLDGTTQESMTARQMINYMFNHARSVRERKAIIDWFDGDVYHPPNVIDPVTLDMKRIDDKHAAFKEDSANPGRFKVSPKDWINVLVDYVPVGFANTLGWAHPNTGDTMTSVMIGGLRTVMNGDFELFTGDLVQWYWPFEVDCFQIDGRRKPYVGAWEWDGTTGRLIPPNVDPALELAPAAHGLGAASNSLQPAEDAQQRAVYHQRQFGQPQGKTKLVARIKPYFRDDENPRMYDYSRVIGVAIANARPNEMADIKIQRQSL